MGYAWKATESKLCILDCKNTYAHLYIHSYIHTCTYIIYNDFIGTASFLSGMGDYDNQEELDGEDEDAGEWTLVDSLHALSIGCREEEAWKR